MFEAIVTFVDYVDQTEEMKQKGLPGHAFTRVFRLEFDTREGFRAWLDTTEYDGSTNSLAMQDLAETIGCTSAEAMQSSGALD